MGNGLCTWRPRCITIALWHHQNMRTTLHIDDDAYKVAVRYAKLRKIRVGQAVSALIVRGSQAEVPVKEMGGLLIFDTPKDFPKITTEQVKRLAGEW